MASDTGILPPGTTPGAGANPAGFDPQAVLRSLMSVDTSSCDADAAVTGVAGCERLAAFLHAVEVRMLSRLAKVRRAEVSGDEFVPEEVGAEVGWSVEHARGRLTDAEDLTDRLPVVLDAVQSGRLGPYQARLLAERTRVLDPDQAVQVAEDVLARMEPGATPATLAQIVRHAVMRADPDAARRRCAHARAARTVVVDRKDDGMAQLRALLPAEQALAVYRCVDEVARGSREPGDERSADARRADALVDLVLGRLDPGLCGEAEEGLRPLVHLTLAASTLAGADDEPGHLAGYGMIPAAVARKIAEDRTGVWKKLVVDPVDGRLLGMSRTTYRPPAALAEHVRTRDRECRMKNCHRTARHADLDHTTAWPTGLTSADNLGTLCRRHHRMKTIGYMRLHQRDGTFIWTTCTGRRYERRPENYDPP